MGWLKNRLFFQCAFFVFSFFPSYIFCSDACPGGYEILWTSHCPLGTYVVFNYRFYSFWSIYPKCCYTCADYSYTIYLDSATCINCLGVIPNQGLTPYCYKCAAGQYLPTSAFNTGCVACPQGTYSKNMENKCSSCSPGTYASGTSSPWCTLCALGKYTDDVRTTACYDCAPGRYVGFFLSGNIGARTCAGCWAGTFSTAIGTTSCVECPAGTYSLSGSSQCTLCFAGTYSLPGSQTCSYCGAGTYSTGIGMPSAATCVSVWPPCPTASVPQCRAVGERLNTGAQCNIACVTCPLPSGSSDYFTRCPNSMGWIISPVTVPTTETTCCFATCPSLDSYPIGTYSKCYRGCNLWDPSSQTSLCTQQGACNAPANGYYFTTYGLAYNDPASCQVQACAACPAGFYSSAGSGCTTGGITSGACAEQCTGLPPHASWVQTTWRQDSCAYVCESGYYHTPDTCLVCPTSFCSVGTVRTICAVDGSDANNAAVCIGCAYDFTLSYALQPPPAPARLRTDLRYFKTSGNVAGNVKSCAVGCAVGAYAAQYLAVGNCYECALDQVCGVGYYQQMPCLMYADTSTPPACAPCDTPQGNFVAYSSNGAAPNTPTSCGYTCGQGSWRDTARFRCTTWTTRELQACESSEFTYYVGGTQDKDSYCGICRLSTAVATPLYEISASAYSACGGSAADGTEACSTALASLRQQAVATGYYIRNQTSPNCSIRCLPGYGLTSGRCELCPVTKYKPGYNADACLVCPSSGFTPAIGMDYCVNASTMAQFLMANASSFTGFVCNIGYYATWSFNLCGAGATEGYCCQPCPMWSSVQVLNSAGSVGSCTRGAFTCNSGYYPDYDAGLCVSCGIIKDGFFAWPATLQPGNNTLDARLTKQNETCALYCNSGYYYSASLKGCAPCAQDCGKAWYRANCSGSSAGVCQPCASVNESFYSAATNCSGLQPCAAACVQGSTYAAANCTPVSNRTCAACTQCSLGSTYVSQACSLWTDTKCSPCNTCPSGVSYLTTPCSLASGAVGCTNCSLCVTGSTLVSQACTPVSDTVCRNCTKCVAGSTYETSACNVSSDRVCRPCTACASGKYAAVACTLTADTQCVSCTAVCQEGRFKASECTSTKDTGCSPCTATCSDSRSFVSAVCTRVQDTVCTQRSLCGVGQYVTGFGKGNSTTLGSNGTCAACTTKPAASLYSEADACTYVCAPGYTGTACALCPVGQTATASGPCYACPANPVCATGTSLLQTAAGVCPTSCLSCSNAASGEYYSGGWLQPSVASLSTVCNVARCPAPSAVCGAGMYLVCYTGCIMPGCTTTCAPCPTALLGASEYFNGSGTALNDPLSCPRAACQPCAAGFYSPSDARCGLATAGACNLACVGLPANAYWIQSDWQQNWCRYACVSGYFNATLAQRCDPCPVSGCAAGQVRALCDPSGVAAVSVRCGACVSPMAGALTGRPDLSYPLTSGAAAGDTSSCTWGCRAGSRLLSGSFCANCTPPDTCSVGSYAVAACLLSNNVQEQPYCGGCSLPLGVSSRFTSAGRVPNDPNSCDFDCPTGYFAVTSPASSRGCYPVTNASTLGCYDIPFAYFVPANATRDAFCASCVFETWLSSYVYGLSTTYAQARAVCSGASPWPAASCKNALQGVQVLLSQYGYESKPGQVCPGYFCSIQCALGYEWSSAVGRCVACGVGYYSSVITNSTVRQLKNGTYECLLCPSGTFASELALASCVNASGMPHFVAGVPTSAVGFYCDGGYIATRSITDPTFGGFVCDPCPWRSNATLSSHVRWVAPDALNQCSRAVVVCDAGYYFDKNVSGICAACPALKSANASLVWLQSPIQMPEDMYSWQFFDPSAACAFVCDPGYYAASATATSAVCSACPLDRRTGNLTYNSSSLLATGETLAVKCAYDCNAGYFADDALTWTCVLCFQNSTSLTPSNGVALAPSGRGKSTRCAFACNSGYYAQTATFWGCLPCDGCPLGFNRTGCGGTSPGVCAMCAGPPNNYYFVNGSGACSTQRCTSCVQGTTYELTACTSWSDAVCANCTRCGGATPFTAQTCVASRDSVCAVCPSGYYTSPASGCVPCTVSCAPGFFMVSNCTAAADAQCVACSAACVAPTTYETRACSGNSDRACSACTTCPSSGWWQAVACQGSRDTGCAACSTCSPGISYRSGVCNATADTVCAVCSARPSTSHYRISSCAVEADAVYALCKSGCDNDTSYVTTACSENSDVVCAPQTQCPTAGTYLTGATSGNRTTLGTRGVCAQCPTTQGRQAVFVGNNASCAFRCNAGYDPATSCVRRCLLGYTSASGGACTRCAGYSGVCAVGQRAEHLDPATCASATCVACDALPSDAHYYLSSGATAGVWYLTDNGTQSTACAVNTCPALSSCGVGRVSSCASGCLGDNCTACLPCVPPAVGVYFVTYGLVRKQADSCVSRGCAPCAPGRYSNGTAACVTGGSSAGACDMVCSGLPLNARWVATDWTQRWCNYTCNAGFYRLQGACSACPVSGCEAGFVRRVCAVDGSDVPAVAQCDACAPPVLSLLQYPELAAVLAPASLRYASTWGAVAGDTTSCIWGCRAGAYRCCGGVCINCSVDFSCASGYYAKAECLLRADVEVAPTCAACTPVVFGAFTGRGAAVNDARSCPYACPSGYYRNSTYYGCIAVYQESDLGCDRMAWGYFVPATTWTNSYCGFCALDLLDAENGGAGALLVMDRRAQALAVCNRTSETVYSQQCRLERQQAEQYLYDNGYAVDPPKAARGATCGIWCSPGYGYRHVGNGSKAWCEMCAVGYYSPNVTQLGCVLCPPHSFAPELQMTSCIDSQGMSQFAESLPAAQNGFRCNTGYFSSFSPVSHAEHSGFFCDVCPWVTAAFFSGALYASVASVLTPCRLSRLVCAAGMFPDYSASACALCPGIANGALIFVGDPLLFAAVSARSISNASDLSLQNMTDACAFGCDAGFYVNASAWRCLRCASAVCAVWERNFFCLDGMTSDFCSNCTETLGANEEFTDVLAGQCVKRCVLGAYGSPDAGGCLPCPTGTYTPMLLASAGLLCTACPPGWTTERRLGATTCTRCPATTPVTADAGYGCALARGPSCAPGFFGSIDSGMCEPCYLDGFYCPGDVTPPQPCADFANVSRCANYTTPVLAQNRSACVDNGVAAYPACMAAASPQACPNNTLTAGAAFCVSQCWARAGYFGKPGAPARLCPRNYTCAAGSVMPTPCPASVAPFSLPGQTDCTIWPVLPCQEGYFAKYPLTVATNLSSNVSSSVACALCPSGAFCAEGSDHPSPKANGSWVAPAGGFYYHPQYVTNAMLCPTGFYCPQGDNMWPTVCSVGACSDGFRPRTAAERCPAGAAAPLLPCESCNLSVVATIGYWLSPGLNCTRCCNSTLLYAMTNGTCVAIDANNLFAPAVCGGAYYRRNAWGACLQGGIPLCDTLCPTPDVSQVLVDSAVLRGQAALARGALWGAQSCVFECAPGFFLSNLSRACEPCPAGTFKGSKGNWTNCSSCAVQASSQQQIYYYYANCSTCSRGARAYTPSVGYTACLTCPDMAVASADATRCLCVPGTHVVLVQGSWEVQACVACSPEQAFTYGWNPETSCALCAPGTALSH